MNCKYCHLTNHYIDKCPTIICKKCKEVGHPQWLCKDKKKIKIIEKKIIEDIKKIPSPEKIKKNLHYFYKIENVEWSEFNTDL